MSIKDRLAKKTQDLIMPVKGDVPTLTSPVRTGPGQMLMVNSLMKESNEKLAVLEQRLREFEGGLPVRLLDAEKIVASKWANRIAESFESQAFAQLKAEIADAGGNVQPIKVRAVAGQDQDEHFEIIFGHRRHRACSELGLPVLALIDSVSDVELFKQMDRENRARADLSPWEQGCMYRNALANHLFSSREQLSRELGIDAGNLSKALRLADLDPLVVAAFESPLDLQFRWAKPLSDALIKDKERVLQAAAGLVASSRQRLPSKVVFDHLVGVVAVKERVEQVLVAGKLVAQIRIDGDRVAVAFERGSLHDADIIRLREVIIGMFSQ